VKSSLSKISLVPYRVQEGTAHFDVSDANFSDFKAQVKDAIAFLQSHMADVKLMMSEPNAIGVLDFAIEWRDVSVQFDSFPAALVREAGSLGLALELSHYPVSEERNAEM
jgi:pentose-5-phosphate-3-epimerase